MDGQERPLVYRLTGVSKIYRKGRREIPAVRELDSRSAPVSGSPYRARPATARRPFCSSSAAWTGQRPAGWSTGDWTWPPSGKQGSGR
jgi:hypothetical protein